MGDKTGISWTDSTWNPVRGCSPVSPGCGRCYAEQQAGRIVRMGKGAPTPYDGLVERVGKQGRWQWTGKVRLIPEHLADPLRWKKPRRVFVNSMSDLFHESLSNEQIAAVFGVMAAAPQHIFQVLTKRAERMRDWFRWARFALTERQRGIVAAPNTPRALLDAALTYLGEAWKPALDAAWRRFADDVWPLPNVWLGVSVENQDAADERIPLLLETPAAVRFLSCEPLLGPVNAFRNWRVDGLAPCWIIAGCESGPGARPADVEWFRSLRDQCKAAGVPYFLKQAKDSARGVDCDDPYHDSEDGCWTCPAVADGPGSKRKAGRVIELPYLDGVQHAAMP